jgi:asparagine synthase (glutamine-hydrolysing)
MKLLLLIVNEGGIIMSVICGIYHPGGQPVTEAEKMMAAFAPYHFDRSQVWQSGNIFFGSRIQALIPETRWEQLPYHDVAAGLLITADAIIDNREELFERLGIPNPQRKEWPDSLLILKAYQCWGEDCPGYLTGDFAFAIWDETKQRLFCARDQVGKTTFYYYHTPSTLAFATLLKPLWAAAEFAGKLSEAWLADYLANPTVISQVDPELTPYENIRMLLPGHTLTLTENGLKIKAYWRIEPGSELRLKSDGEYEEAFREVFFEAVRCRLRSNRPLGVFLSGGLDSSSIACIAARFLQSQGKSLKGFTAVPMEGYQDWTASRALADETPYVEAISQHAGNIQTVYGRATGRHALNTTDRISAILEQPYKYFANAVWIDDLLEIASGQHGVGLMLNGQSGNGTISWGVPELYFNSLLRGFKWFDFWREISVWGEAHERTTFSLVAQAALSLLPATAYRGWRWLRGQTNPLRENSAINPQLAKKWGFPKRFYQFGGEPYGLPYHDTFAPRAVMNCHQMFNQVAVLEKKMSLAHQLAIRDPSRDKRVIEFCLRVPDSQYVRDGQDRFLLRRAMQGMLPDKVRLNSTVRGKQGVDWLQRLEPHWSEVECELKTLFTKPEIQYYFDVPRLQGILDRVARENDFSVPQPYHKLLINALIAGRYIAAHC